MDDKDIDIYTSWAIKIEKWNDSSIVHCYMIPQNNKEEEKLFILNFISIY